MDLNNEDLSEVLSDVIFLSCHQLLIISDKEKLVQSTGMFNNQALVLSPPSIKGNVFARETCIFQDRFLSGLS